jgi:hypothetical protein
LQIDDPCKEIRVVFKLFFFFTAWTSHPWTWRLITKLNHANDPAETLMPLTQRRLLSQQQNDCSIPTHTGLSQLQSNCSISPMVIVMRDQEWESVGSDFVSFCFCFFLGSCDLVSRESFWKKNKSQGTLRGSTEVPLLPLKLIPLGFIRD